MSDTTMETIILNGKQTSREIELEIAEEVKTISQTGLRVPHLVAVLVGDDGPSRTYVRNKIKASNRVGYRDTLLKFDSDISQDFLIEQINKLNQDTEVDGYIVQLPLPDHISVEEITDHIDPKKDVDGFTPANFGKINALVSGLLPATPKGILELLKRYDIETRGKHCVVVGNSLIVGSPLTTLLSGPGKATVTVCHIFTKDLAFHTKQADILVVAVGKPNLITEDMVTEGVVIVDVGINRVPDENAERGYVIRGDVDFENVAGKCSYITPVPGGVGPMTIASLLMNTLQAYKEAHGKN